MKQIKCELCGSIELIKQEGIYVCKYCNTQYSIEEAKKLMTDGVVEVVGKVKVDNSDELANLYQIARRAKNDDNAESAAKYYDMILVKDPNSWEATFYIVYFRAKNCKVAEIQSAATSIYNCTNTVLNLIKDYVNEEAEQEAAVNEAVSRIIDISQQLYNAATNSYYNTSSSIRDNYTRKYLYETFAPIYSIYNLGNQLESIYGDKKYACDLAVVAWKLGVDYHKRINNFYDRKYRTQPKTFDETVHLFDETIRIYKTSDKSNLAFAHIEKKIEQYGPLKSEQVNTEHIPNDGKSRLTTLLLCFFLGLLGIHRFYTKNIGIGLIQLVTLGGCGIWALIDFIMICTGHYKDGKGNKLVK